MAFKGISHSTVNIQSRKYYGIAVIYQLSWLVEF